MRPIIRIDNLGKQYRIGARQAPYRTLRESLTEAAQAPWRWLRGERRAADNTIWALKDVNLEVRPGEVVGIIGRNGAGKSTLLKILSRITEPTTGQVDLYGRVGSLLEVGTGFHPELTGRENIYLNGAILGMKRREIARQFDAIVAFAEIEQFLDTPVKHYSSGMYMRLAFAVAAHLEPEILVVDEVLAVGDVQFQNKCLGKIREVASGGRTVLFVSHNMHAVSVLCEKALTLEAGKLAYFGETRTAIGHFQRVSMEHDNRLASPYRRPGSGEFRFTRVSPEKHVFDAGEEKSFRFRVERCNTLLTRANVSAHIVNSLGLVIAQCDSTLANFWLHSTEEIEGTFRLRTPWLKPGHYRVDMFICAFHLVDAFEDACAFEVSTVLPYSYCGSADATANGVVFADFSWSSTVTTPACGSLASD